MASIDLYAIGNALVDSEYEVSDELLQSLGVEKRHMTLIDAERRSYLEHGVQGKHSRHTGGGSAGNTVVALSQLGGKAFYACRVADDSLGRFYRDDLAANGVQSNLVDGLASSGQTGTCMVMVTPDAERSMSTFLGATSELEDSALREDAIRNAKVYYMEGYLAAQTGGLAAALKGRAIARAAGVKLATTLSDMSMINFCRAGLEAMVGGADAGKLDFLFCNEEEAQVWCGVQDIDAVCERLSALATTVCLTRSAKGCIVIEGAQRTTVEAAKVKAIDTNGAGDMFAGAFLFAVTQGYSHAQAARLANDCAGRVVAQYGNRLQPEELQQLRKDFEAANAKG
ncbi:MAG: adenosine kinase [Rhodoferax sp.]|nr:MAG: adenosine kinase [Rhodoferax sp.]